MNQLVEENKRDGVSGAPDSHTAES